jgi:DNA-binding protein Fis
VFELEMSLFGPGGRCWKCPKREECHSRPEFQAWKAREKQELIEVATHANRGVVKSALEDGRLVVVDEMPALVESAGVSAADLSAVRPLLAQLAANPEHRPDDAAAWHAWLAFLEDRGPQPVLSIQRVDTTLPAVRGPAVRVARFARLALLPGTRLQRTPDGQGWEAFAPNHLFELLSRGQVTLLSATPTEVADGELTRVWFDKHPNHTRVVYPYANAGRGKLRVGEQAELVEWCVRRVAREAAARGGRGLLVTFKDIAEALRTAGETRVDVAHYGAVQGRNDWEMCTAVLALGTPWDRHRQVAEATGSDRDAAWSHAADRAAAEVYQAIERVRSVRRATSPLWQAVVGQIPPVGWRVEGTEVSSLEEARREDDLALLEDALRAVGGNQTRLAKLLGVRRNAVSDWRSRKSVPAEHLDTLRDLSKR